MKTKDSLDKAKEAISGCYGIDINDIDVNQKHEFYDRPTGGISTPVEQLVMWLYDIFGEPDLPVEEYYYNDRRFQNKSAYELAVMMDPSFLNNMSEGSGI